MKKNDRPGPSWKWLAGALFTFVCSVGCCWVTYAWDIPLAPFGLIFLFLAAFLMMYTIAIAKSESNENGTNPKVENGADKKEAVYSNKDITVISVLLGLCSALSFAGPHIDPTLTPEDIAIAPYLGTISLLLSVGCSFFLEWVNKKLQNSKD